MLIRVSTRIFLVLSLALSGLPLMAQGSQLKQRVEQCLAESQQYFGTRKYDAGADRVLEAANIVKSKPRDFPQYSAVSLVSTAVDFLHNESSVARSNGDEDSSTRALSAETGLLRTLRMWEPQNSQWSRMSAAAQRGSSEESTGHSTMPATFNPYVPNRDGPSIGGTNSRYANTGPGSSPEYHQMHITPSSLKSGPWGPGLGRARIDWSKMPSRRSGGGGGGGGAQGTNCPNCGHYMPPGVSWCASCGH